MESLAHSLTAEEEGPGTLSVASGDVELQVYKQTGLRLVPSSVKIY